MAYLLVFLGGGLGAALRHGVNRASLALAPGYPLGTLIVNVVGSIAIGLLAGVFAFRGDAAGSSLRIFLTTGLLGGFTTFSAFSLDAAVLAQRGDYLQAAGYVALSVGLSLTGVFSGLAVSRLMLT